MATSVLYSMKKRANKLYRGLLFGSSSSPCVPFDDDTAGSTAKAGKLYRVCPDLIMAEACDSPDAAGDTSKSLDCFPSVVAMIASNSSFFDDLPGYLNASFDSLAGEDDLNTGSARAGEGRTNATARQEDETKGADIVATLESLVFSVGSELSGEPFEVCRTSIGVRASTRARYAATFGDVGTVRERSGNQEEEENA